MSTRLVIFSFVLASSIIAAAVTEYIYTPVCEYMPKDLIVQQLKLCAAAGPEAFEECVGRFSGRVVSYSVNSSNGYTSILACAVIYGDVVCVSLYVNLTVLDEWGCGDYTCVEVSAESDAGATCVLEANATFVEEGVGRYLFYLNGSCVKVVECRGVVTVLCIRR